MLGKTSGDILQEDSLTRLMKETEALKKDIADLEKKKLNLQVEIDKVLAETREKLGVEYQVKKKDLEITYSSQFARLEQEKTAVQKDKAFVVEQDAKNIEKAKELEVIVEEQKQAVSDIDIKRVAIEKQRVANEKYIKEETQKLRDAQAAVVAEVEKLSNKSEELSLLSDSLADKQLAFNGRVLLIEKKEKELSDLEAILNIKEERLTTLEKNIQINVAASADAQDKVLKELAIAEKARIEAEEVLKKNQADARATQILGDSLSDLRNSLNEKDITLREKEKAQVLREREIDGKIATLKKLRGE